MKASHRAAIVLSVLFLACGYVVVAFAGYPIYLSAVVDHRGFEQRACAAWLPTGPAHELEWWIVATPGSRRHQQLRSAKRLDFEMDPWSGTREVCLGKQVAFKDEPSNVVRAVVDSCHPLTKLISLRGPIENQVAIRLRDKAAPCDDTPDDPRVVDVGSR